MRHQCRLPREPAGWDGIDPPTIAHGQIALCADCGRWWEYRYAMICRVWSPYWRRVRWWHGRTPAKDQAMGRV